MSNPESSDINYIFFWAHTEIEKKKGTAVLENELAFCTSITHITWCPRKEKESVEQCSTASTAMMKAALNQEQ